MLAEAAFDAGVYGCLDHGDGLDVLGMCLGIIVQDDAGIQDAVRIDQGLELLHHGIGLAPPLLFDVWSHVAARAVFGLQ